MKISSFDLSIDLLVYLSISWSEYFLGTTLQTHHRIYDETWTWFRLHLHSIDTLSNTHDKTNAMIAIGAFSATNDLAALGAHFVFDRNNRADAAVMSHLWEEYITDEQSMKW